MEAYEKALKKYPSRIDIRYKLAIIKKTLGKTKEAIADLEKALKSNKDFHIARSELADLYAQIGKTKEAAAQYRQLLIAKPLGLDTQAIQKKLDSLTK